MTESVGAQIKEGILTSAPSNPTDLLLFWERRLADLIVEAKKEAKK